MKLVVVYKAADEFSAITIKETLESQGISAMIRSTQIPWYDNIMQRATGVWGEILVAKEKEEEAKRVIEEYLADLKEGSKE
ncbi:DUF2007 domain-containing protein [bacterium]|nr:DUF2007 domain-containing protein [bacterium]MCG2678155.1 DUF2007 domain-containing protein [bacterium]